MLPWREDRGTKVAKNILSDFLVVQTAILLKEDGKRLAYDPTWETRLEYTMRTVAEVSGDQEMERHYRRRKISHNSRDCSTPGPRDSRSPLPPDWKTPQNCKSTGQQRENKTVASPNMPRPQGRLSPVGRDCHSPALQEFSSSPLLFVPETD
ncbi:Hypp5211 [Branchiostoma lanceolatum]|uniref:Hypp5211 protein n=1 Tax=Branchiostoma lanceolatum TaxID=7740 RepID=A0A8K0F3Q0_BRALA|nr:Hypp5211 [Branchiostoma lanceolatum]